MGYQLLVVLLLVLVLVMLLVLLALLLLVVVLLVLMQQRRRACLLPPPLVPVSPLLILPSLAQAASASAGSGARWCSASPKQRRFSRHTS